jgi:hypothetical protein
MQLTHSLESAWFQVIPITRISWLQNLLSNSTFGTRYILEKTATGCEKYGPELESENTRDMVELLEAVGDPIPSKLTTVKVRQLLFPRGDPRSTLPPHTESPYKKQLEQLPPLSKN